MFMLIVSSGVIDHGKPCVIMNIDAVGINIQYGNMLCRTTAGFVKYKRYFTLLGLFL